MSQVLDFNQPRKWRTWSRQSPQFWCMYREQPPEMWRGKLKYLIFFDHSRERDAKEFVLAIMERYKNIVAGKISIYAINGEKIMVLLAEDDKMKDMIQSYCKAVGFFLWRLADKDEPTNHDAEALIREGKYKHALAKSIRRD